MGRVSFTTDNYYDAMKKLLPQGPAWELEDNTFFMKMLYLAALEFARLDADISKMIDESDPQSASVTLLDWFHQWGIPEECRAEDDDLEVLRTELLIKIRTLGLTFQELVYLIGQSCGYSETKIDSKHVLQLHRLSMTPFIQKYGLTGSIQLTSRKLIPFLLKPLQEYLNVFRNGEMSYLSV